MSRLLRRVVPPVAALLVAAGVVVWDPSAPQAMAYQPPPQPIPYPSSLLSSMGSATTTTVPTTPMTSAQWNTFLTQHPELMPAGGTTATVGGKAGLSGASAAGTVIAGIAVGTDIGSDIAHGFGISDTGDFWCDLSSLVTGSSGCTVGAAPGYVLNSDIVTGEPGWVNGVNGFTSSARVAEWTITSEPEAGEVAPVGVTFQIAKCNGSGTSTSVTGVEAFFRDATTGALTSRNYTVTHSVQGMSTGCGAPYVGNVTAPFTDATGKVLDHLVAFAQGFAGTGTASVMIWYPKGHPQRPPEVSPDPVRWWTTTWQCSDGSVGTKTSDPWHETDPEWPGFPSAQCAAGVLTHLTIGQTTEGAGTTTVYEWDAPAELEQWATEHPECVGGSCRLELEILDPETGRWLSCLSNPGLCVGWLPEASNPEATPDEYRCKYANSVVALSECKVYGENPGNDKYADPGTGQEPTGDPSPGGQPGPSTDCPPPFSWLSLFNPWWYYKGATCALEWAFVPPADSIGDLIDNVQETLGSRPPWSIIAAVPPLIEGLGDGFGSGCSGLPNFSPIPGKPLQMACAPPDSPGFRLGYGLMTGVIWVGVLLGLWRMAHNAVGGKE